MERTILLPIAALIVQAVAQASPSPQLAETDAATASLIPTATKPGSNDRRIGPGGFEENKGQVKQSDGQAAPYVKFRLTDGSTNVFLLESGIAYQFNRMHDPEGYAELAHRSHLSSEDEARLDDLRKQRRLETYRMDMTLEGADPHARISTEGRSTDFTNYYLSGVEALDVRTFGKVVYHRVYPGIDWEVTTTEKGFEQDFIVHPGADPSLIKMRFKGHEELYVDGQGQLIHGNRLGRFVEAGPASFQGAAVVHTSFDLRDDLLTFDISEYDETRALRIDPTREWGTYYGGGADDWLKDMATDDDRNSYVAGYTASSEENVIATTIGLVDSTYANGQDAFLVKFDPEGQRMWGTYYGGANDDYFVSCAVRGGDLVAAGTSNTPDLGTSGTQQPNFAYSTEGDALLVKFNPDNGSRIWATYYGRVWIDIGKSCAIDPWGFIYMAGESETVGTLGGSDTIAYDGFQMQMRSLKNGFLVKFDADGSREWGTYYGGYNPYSIGFCTDVATDPFGNVVVFGACGYNANDADTYVSSGAHHETHGSTIQPPGTGGDAYVAKFDSAGVRLWGTYYGGASNENVWTGTIDSAGNIYVAGETLSDTGIYKAGHKAELAGGLDAYLAKFTPSGELDWGTYYGGPENDEIRSSVSDAFGHVFMIGMTRSTSQISFNGYQMDHGGGDYDAMLVGFKVDSGDLIMGSYYGGSFNDQAFGSASDTDGALFIGGVTNSSNDTSICSSNGFDTSLSSTQDAFAAKFRTDCLGHAAGNQEQGSPCVDPDPCTINDVYNASCVCAGTYPDAGQILGNVILGSGIQYTFTVFPAIPNAEYTWVVPPGWIAVDIHSDTLLVTAPSGAGIGDIGVWGENGDCLLDTTTLSVLVQNVVGIAEHGAEGYFSIRPNPNNGRFGVLRNAHLQGLVDYELLDATGRRKQTNGTFNGQRVDIDMSEASSGVYFLRLRHDSGTEVLRLVVQH